MKTKLLLCAMSLLCNVLTVGAQDNSKVDELFEDYSSKEESTGKFTPSNKIPVPEHGRGLGGTRNCIMLSGAAGWYLSELHDGKTGERGVTCLDMSVDYQHVFGNGMGFAVTFSKAHGDHGCCVNNIYGGISFVYSYTNDHNWNFSAQAGFGIATIDYGMMDKTGVGMLMAVNINKKFGKHFGIGAYMRLNNSRFVDNTGDSYYKDKSMGCGYLTFGIGPRVYF